MAEVIESLRVWFWGLGEQYGVNPIIFGSIYVGAIPFFTASLAWLYRNYRLNKSIILPAFSAIGFFISAYIYLLFAGENIPWWVYGLVILMVILGAYSTCQKVRRKIKKIDKKISTDGKI
ncbi:hypothetical protein [Fodinibius salsisoli]|uniref:Uncharacterized protein n=1 Tax=Fodinibius salsisoli TaxID=2820877 RepID=A0ABT3PLB0_9BACT|nr:hypothetical protein [Fodinibius salsisoli]MCW9706717.1 hypothetical protein [Fodinibius salsisoli]